MASEFFDRLFDGITNRVSVDDYAHWIEREPRVRFGSEALAKISIVIAGEDEASSQVVSFWLLNT